MEQIDMIGQNLRLVFFVDSIISPAVLDQYLTQDSFSYRATICILQPGLT